MRDFFRFRRMITPIYIQILFCVGALASIIAGIALTAGGLAGRMSDNGRAVLVGLLLIFVGPLVVRLYCERRIMLFRIHETLTEMKNERKQ